jgi:hypothetical protein
MKKQLLVFPVIALCAGLLVWTCSKKSPTGPGDGGGGEVVETYSYTATGTVLYITIPEEIVQYSYCLGTTLVIDYDTTTGGTMSINYAITGDTLMLFIMSDTIRFLRSGTGSGLIGTWVAIGDVEDGPTKLVFSASTVEVTSEDCNADDYIDWDWPFDSAYYYLTLTRVSCNQLQLTGTVSGETVTLTWNSAGDCTFTSTDGSHTQYTCYANPTYCPNDQVPSWYYSGFLSPNSRSAKQAARTPAPRPRKQHTFFR